MLEHAERVEALLRQGKRKEAKALPNKHIESQFAKARAGEVINLSDLIAAQRLSSSTTSSGARRNQKGAPSQVSLAAALKLLIRSTALWQTATARAWLRSSSYCRRIRSRRLHIE